VGWLLVGAALLIFAGGVGTRVMIGRNRRRPGVARVVGGFRESAVARLLFGPVLNDPLDDDELDGIFVIPAIVVACGVCLTGVFLLGYEVLS
jgi:hypothetical protein